MLIYCFSFTHNVLEDINYVWRRIVAIAVGLDSVMRSMIIVGKERRRIEKYSGERKKKFRCVYFV